MLDLHTTDRHQRALHLRRVTPEDILAVHALERAMVDDGRGMVLDPDELGSPEELAQRRASLHSDLGMQIGAFHDHILTGTCEVSRIPIRRCRHVGSLSMGIHPQWRGAGIGRLLLEQILTWSDASCVLRLELFVRADNPAAMSLYNSVGFELCCTRPAFVRDPDGQWIDDHYMARVASN